MKPNFFAFSAACALTLSACSDNVPESRVDATLEMAKVFAAVENKESADAAAEKFAKFSARLDDFPETPADATKDAEFAVGRLFSQIARLKRESYFDSEALKNALFPAEK